MKGYEDTTCVFKNMLLKNMFNMLLKNYALLKEYYGNLDTTCSINSSKNCSLFHFLLTFTIHGNLLEKHFCKIIEENRSSAKILS